MLKVWNDSSRQSHSTFILPRAKLEEIVVDKSTALLETSSVGLTPELDLNTVSLKRTRRSSNQDSDTYSIRSSKKVKTSTPHSSHQKHSSSAFTSASGDELLELAKARNSEFSRTSNSPY